MAWGDYEVLDGLNALDAVQEAAKMALPIGIGAGAALGTVKLLDLALKDAGTRARVAPYKWLAAAGGAAAVGGAWMKFKSKDEGAMIIAAGAVASAVGYLTEKYISTALSGYKAFQIGKPQPVFEKYVTAPAQPVLGRYVNMPSAPAEVLGSYGRNPGIYG